MDLSKSGQAFKFAKRRPGWELPQLDIDLSTSSTAPLEAASGRQTCPGCGRKRAWFCYDCVRPLTATPPEVQLPFEVVVVTHSQELRSKNTGVHAAILSPRHVSLVLAENCADDLDCRVAAGERRPERCAVLFPSDDPADSSDVIDPSSLGTVYVVDCPWKKARELVRRPPFSGMRRVALRRTRTAFWRFHTRGVAEEGVCTIEALLHLFRGMCQSGRLPPLQLPAAQAAEPDHQAGAEATAAASDAQPSADDAQPAAKASVAAAAGDANAGAQPAATTSMAATVAGDASAQPAADAGAAAAGAAEGPRPGPGVGGSGEGTSPGRRYLHGGGDAPPQDAAACHCFDNLLWYFSHQHAVVQQAAQQRQAAWRAKGGGGGTEQEGQQQQQQQQPTSQRQQPTSQRQQCASQRQQPCQQDVTGGAAQQGASEADLAAAVGETDVQQRQQPQPQLPPAKRPKDSCGNPGD